MAEDDIRQSWFMNQHFSPEELEQIYQCDQKYGKVCKVVPNDIGFNLFHIEDTEQKIDLVFMKEEEQVRRWGERMGYSFEDGKTSQAKAERKIL